MHGGNTGREGKDERLVGNGGDENAGRWGKKLVEEEEGIPRSKRYGGESNWEIDMRDEGRG